EHLAYGGELFCLDELFFQALEFGDIAAGKDHAFDFSSFVGEGAEIETDAAPLSRLVAHANFQRSEGLASGENIGKEREQGGKIFAMGAAAELHICGFGELIAENFRAARTDESVM